MASSPLSLLKVARHAGPRRLQSVFAFNTRPSMSTPVAATRLSYWPYTHTAPALSSISQRRMLSSVNTAPSPQSNSDVHEEYDQITSASPSPAIDQQRVKLAATRSETPLSITQCLKLGQSLSTKALLRNLTFLNRELPVRFSKRIVELNSLPNELKETEPFLSLIKNYSMSFHELQTYSDNSRLLFLSPSTHHSEDVDLDDNETLQATLQKEYADLLQAITNRHKQDVICMAHGISLFKRYQTNRNNPSDGIQQFLRSFNRGRLGIRIMVGHHLALQHQFYHPNEPSSSAYLSTPSSTHSRRIGIIEPQCDIEAMIVKASQSAQFVFFQHYSTVFPPNVHIEHSKEVGGRMVRFPVVPALLHHILFELLKNSMRATAEFHGLEKSSYPEIEVKLSSTPEGDLNILIKDHGGGMPPEQVVRPFDYMFTTASNTVCIDFPSIMTAVEAKPQNATLGENLPLCGFGFGLATSKQYARLFGGDLTLHSIPGSGTEATIRLKRLEDQIEQLHDN